jgi:hypothetical protein
MACTDADTMTLIVIWLHVQDKFCARVSFAAPQRWCKPQQVARDEGQPAGDRVRLRRERVLARRYPQLPQHTRRDQQGRGVVFGPQACAGRASCSSSKSPRTGSARSSAATPIPARRDKAAATCRGLASGYEAL